MHTHDYAGHALEVDPEGFLVDSADWTPEIGEAIAEEAGVGALTERHWRVISFCREDAAQQGQSPGLRRIAKHSGIGMKDLYKLFPKGPGKLAALIAGLPKPKSCV
jgi:tRNA 2-thiouridine synthesizing protein E